MSCLNTNSNTCRLLDTFGSIRIAGSLEMSHTFCVWSNPLVDCFLSDDCQWKLLNMSYPVLARQSFENKWLPTKTWKKVNQVHIWSQNASTLQYINVSSVSSFGDVSSPVPFFGMKGGWLVVCKGGNYPTTHRNMRHLQYLIAKFPSVVVCVFVWARHWPCTAKR